MEKNMKKPLALIVVLLVVICALLAFTACNDDSQSTSSFATHFDGTCQEKGFTRYTLPGGRYYDVYDKEFGDHVYDDGTTISAQSCTANGVVEYTCTLCEHKDTRVSEKLGHDYAVSTSTATCTQAGTATYTCSRCEDSYTQEVTALPHIGDGTILHDDNGHWQLCKYGCGTKCESASHSFDKTFVQTICTEYNYTILACKVCDYTYNEIDYDSKLNSHTYEAYTCKFCQRDMLLDYIDTFESKGNERSNLIPIKSEQELTLLFDYITLFHLTSDNKKYFKLEYVSLSTDSNADNHVMKYLSKAIDLHTAANWGLSVGYPQSGEVTYISAYCLSNNTNRDYSKLATITPNDYDDDIKETYTQLHSYQFDEYPNTRGASFENFPYKKRNYQMTVSTSDQLFYAFEHGYTPIARDGSIAQTILNKAKDVSRKIIDDKMSDLDKVRAIYLWLVKEVQYDHGIVDAQEINGEARVWQYCSSYYLEGVFLYNIAVCDGISKAFCVLAGMENIKCIRVTSKDHAWNKIWLDVDGDGEKEWYATDATWANKKQTLSSKGTNEVLSVDDLLFTDTQKAALGQSANNYKDVGCDAVTQTNPYSHVYYGEKMDDSCDYVIESEEEFIALFAYIAACVASENKAVGTTVTVDLFITVEYCANSEAIADAVKVAFSKHNKGYSVSRTVPSSTDTYDGVEGYSFTLYITIR